MLSTKIFVYFVKNLFFCCGMWYNTEYGTNGTRIC